MAQVFQCAGCGAHICGAAWFPKAATDSMGRLHNRDYAGPHFCSQECRDDADN